MANRKDCTSINWLRIVLWYIVMLRILLEVVVMVVV